MGSSSWLFTDSGVFLNTVQVALAAHWTALKLHNLDHFFNFDKNKHKAAPQSEGLRRETYTKLTQMAFLTENQTPFSLSSVFMRSVMHNVDCCYYFCCEMASKTKSVHFLTYLKEQVPPAQTALKLGCLLAYLTSRPLLAEAKLHSCFRQFSDFTTSYLLQELLLLSGLKPFLICWRHV